MSICHRCQSFFIAEAPNTSVQPISSMSREITPSSDGNVNVRKSRTSFYSCLIDSMELLTPLISDISSHLPRNIFPGGLSRAKRGQGVLECHTANRGGEQAKDAGQ